MTRPRPIPRCGTCFDVGWVCENHPLSPWDATAPRGCTCSAGMPCRECNPSDADHPPRLPTRFKPDADKHGQRH